MEAQQSKTVRTLSLFLLLIPMVMRSQNFTTSTWESLGPEGGYLTALAQNPQNNNLFTVTYDYPARLFKSTNNGDSWTSGWPFEASIGFLAVNPNNPLTMYAIPTSLGNGNSMVIYKSVNGGGEWSRIAIMGQPDVYYYPNDFHLDPKDPNKLSIVGYSYTNLSTLSYGSFSLKSTNGGSTWTLKTFGGVSIDQFYAYSAEIDPSDPNTQYVGGLTIRADGYTNPKVFKTTDNGASWSDITGFTIQGYVYDLLIDPVSTNKLHAVSSGGVYRSTNKGATWLTPNVGYAWGSKLFFDPNNSSTLYAYGNGNTCFWSNDGGQSWVALGTSLPGGVCNQLVIQPPAASTLHAVTRSGYFKSTNGGQTWAASNTGLLASEIPVLKCAPSLPKTMFISFLYSGLYKTSNTLGKGAATTAVGWQKLPEYSYCEGIMKLEVNPTDPDILYIQEGAS
jgi:hypothetical protein